MTKKKCCDITQLVKEQSTKGTDYQSAMKRAKSRMRNRCLKLFIKFHFILRQKFWFWAPASADASTGKICLSYWQSMQLPRRKLSFWNPTKRSKWRQPLYRMGRTSLWKEELKFINFLIHKNYSLKNTFSDLSKENFKLQWATVGESRHHQLTVWLICWNLEQLNWC